MHASRRKGPARAERNAQVVRRFYDELWNEWRLELADEILTQDLRFRGSRGLTDPPRPLRRSRAVRRPGRYVGAAFFRLSDAMIAEAWVVGDSHVFWEALTRAQR
jgi:hypothetical protein